MAFLVGLLEVEDGQPGIVLQGGKGQSSVRLNLARARTIPAKAQPLKKPESTRQNRRPAQGSLLGNGLNRRFLELIEEAAFGRLGGLN